MFFVLLVSTACATTHEHTTWDEDAAEGVSASTPLPSHPSIGGVAFRSTAIDTREASPAAGPTIDAQALELSILRFTSKRRQLSQELAADAAHGWPKPLEAAFSSIVEALDRAMEAPRGSLPRRVLIQARVSLEVEKENSESKYGPAPAALVERIGKLFVAIALQMRAAAPIDDGRRTRSLENPIALIWPVQPVIVTSQFGYRRDPILGRENVRFHAGVDLGGDAGDLVHASAPGRVVSAGWTGGHGRAVVVQHAGGFQTMYAHLRQIVVAIGVEVEAGSPIGLMGSSGRSTGPHLHFELRRGGVPLDPLEVLGPSFAVHGSKHEANSSARN